ncbi:LTA synthase family protein [Haloimpatiens sp. FM7330]|uniref:LTA synthase family protein n=1 Tax=Haloimpatiens sp. FM7330 TaxID=3298610 RepID=UPI00362C1C9D
MKKLIDYVDLILFLVLVTIKLLIYGDVINPYFRTLGVLGPIFASVLVIASFSLLFKRKGRARYLYIFNIIISAFIIADINYFRYYKDVLTIPVIRNGILLGAVNSAVKDILKPQDLLLLTDIILIPIVKSILKHMEYKKKTFSRKFKLENNISFKKRAISFVILFAVGFISNKYYIHKLRVEQPRLIEGMYNKIYICNAIGNLNCHFLDVYNFVNKSFFDKKAINNEKQKDIKTYLTNNTKPSGDKFKNVGKDKNLIMIQVEALQEFVINQKIEGQEITPNLNRWLKRSLYFDNYYYQVAGGNTSDAEFMSLNSFYPATSGAAYYIYSGDEYNSLATELKDKKYDAAAFHGYKEGFWNRNVMYRKEGFDNFYGENSFNVDEKIGLGISDESFLNQSLEKMKKMKEPYFSFLVTLTSHFPFEAVDKYGEFNVGKYEDTFIGNYLKSIHYTDKQLGMFLDKLEKKGMLDDSIVVLYGDHFAIPRNHANELYSFVGVNGDTEFNWMKYQKVPLMIRFPNDENKGVNHVTAGQMDLYPTLANMFGLKNKYMFGRDIFNVEDRMVVFRTGSFIDDKVFYSSSNSNYYDLKAGEKLKETEELKKKKENAIKQLDYSDTLLDNNLIKSFNKGN